MKSRLWAAVTIGWEGWEGDEGNVFFFFFINVLFGILFWIIRSGS